MKAKLQQGFSLLELSLALMLSSVLMLGWMSLLTTVWQQSSHTRLTDTQAQLFYQFALWLGRDLERASQSGNWRWRWEDGCLLYGENGVRLREGGLQWRPQGRQCHQNGWISLHDPNGFELTHFDIQALPGNKALVEMSAAYLGQNWHWIYPLGAPVELER